MFKDSVLIGFFLACAVLIVSLFVLHNPKQLEDKQTYYTKLCDKYVVHKLDQQRMRTCFINFNGTVEVIDCDFVDSFNKRMCKRLKL